MNQKMAQSIIQAIVDLRPEDGLGYSTIMGTMRCTPQPNVHEGLDKAGLALDRLRKGNRLAEDFQMAFVHHYQPILIKDKKEHLEMPDVFPVSPNEYGIHRPITDVILDKQGVGVVDFSSSPASAATELLRRLSEPTMLRTNELTDYYVWVLRWNEADIEDNIIWSHNLHDFLEKELLRQ